MSNFAITSNDFKVRVFNFQTFKLKHTLSGHSGVINGIGYLTEDLLVTGSGDFNLKLWDLNRGKIIDSVSNFSYNNEIDFFEVHNHSIRY